MSFVRARHAGPTNVKRLSPINVGVEQFRGDAIASQTDTSTLQKVRLHKKHAKHRQRLELELSVTPQVCVCVCVCMYVSVLSMDMYGIPVWWTCPTGE